MEHFKGATVLLGRCGYQRFADLHRSDLDFGVWKKNKFQGFEYSSMYPFQEVVQDVNEEFWDVYQLNNDIIFVSSQNIYLYKNDNW
jgi:hypothetical protein